ncbi:hypothetical protein BH10BAC4_BH10BAC4_20780 [soil metagenome]
MTSKTLTPILTINILLLLSLAACSQVITSINIQKEVQNKNVEVFNREVTLIEEQAHPGIRLNAALEDGVIWLKDVQFTNGTIEFDTRGKNIKSHSFVGVAFHGLDNITYEAIYFRPFRFQETEESLRSHAVQYIALPTYSWQALREKFPNKFESSLDPIPDPDDWFHVKVVVTESKISTYVNGNSKPCLVVDKMGKNKTGSIGFYVADTSGGDFANLKITKD